MLQRGHSGDACDLGAPSNACVLMNHEPDHYIMIVRIYISIINIILIWSQDYNIKSSSSHPTPLMHIKLPPSLPSHPLATDTIAFPIQTSPPPLTMPYIVAASSKTPDITSAFLDQMKKLKSQMIQMQQTQNFLIKNIMSQAWSPLPALKVAPFPAQMFETRPAQRLLPCFTFFL